MQADFAVSYLLCRKRVNGNRIRNAVHCFYDVSNWIWTVKLTTLLIIATSCIWTAATATTTSSRLLLSSVVLRQWWLQIFMPWQSKNIHSIFFAISQTASNKTLQMRNKHFSISILPMTTNNLAFFSTIIIVFGRLTFASFETVGLFENCTSVAFSIVFSSKIVAWDWLWPNGFFPYKHW